MDRVRRRLRSVFKRDGVKAAAASQPVQPLPLLPLTQRPLIPVDSDASNTASSPSPDSNYGAFSRLPAEIRLLILTYAFGDRTIHVDLSWRHPLVRQSLKSNPQEVTKRHCGLGQELIEDETKPKRWQWFSCVCHRSLETEEIGKIAFFKFESRIWPFEDECLSGKLCDCGCSDARELGDCFLGATGWMLACRGAYADGMDVLFSTNTFYISSTSLLLNIRRLLPAQWVNKIKSAQLAVGRPRRSLSRDSLIQGLWSDSEEEYGACEMLKVFDELPGLLPNLQRLEFYVQSILLPARNIPSAKRLSELKSRVVEPLEEMIRRFGTAKEIVVAVPLETWKALEQAQRGIEGDAFLGKPEPVDRGTIHDHWRYWRALGQGDDGSDIGYWMRTGWNDHTLVNDPGMVSCFGGGAIIRDIWGYYRREAELGRARYGENTLYTDN